MTDIPERAGDYDSCRDRLKEIVSQFDAFLRDTDGVARLPKIDTFDYDAIELVVDVAEASLSILLEISDDADHHDDIEEAVLAKAQGWRGDLGRLLDRISRTEWGREVETVKVANERL